MKRYKLAIIALMIIFVIFAIPRLFLMPRLTHEIEEEIGQALNSSDVQVDLSAPWGWELLFGVVPRLDLKVQDAVIDGLHIAKVELQGQQLRFDPQALWREQQLIYMEATDVTGQLVVTEEALNELLWREVDPDRFLSLQVSPSGVDLSGSMSFLNMEWSITVRGDLEVRHSSALRYVLKNFEVQETRIPSILLEVLSENYEFVVDFGVFPYPVEIKDVLLAEQQILVTFGGL